MFDCLIIGAGPAGASAAYHLGKSGKSVVVIEKFSLPRQKTCGGGVSPAIAEVFDFDFAPVIENQITTVKYTWKMGDPVTADIGQVKPMWVVNRATFDHFLMQQAQKKGAQLKDNTEVTGIKFNGSHWEVSTNQGSFIARYLIAADGATGPCVKWLGLAARPSVLGATLEVPSSVPKNLANTAYFEFGLLKNGYIWNFPKSDGYTISGGFFRGGKGKSEELKKQLYDFAKQFGLNSANGSYREYSLNLWSESQPLHTNNALIAGEAAGILDPLTAEGIRPAIFTGMKAAEAIEQALGGSTSALINYSKTINEEWGNDMGLAQKLAGLFYQFPGVAYKVGVKRPRAAQLMAQILCGELRYSDVTEYAMSRLKKSLTFGLGG